MNERELVIGMDVGSTTVKAVVIDPDSREILWHDYQRHHTKQPEKCLELLETILAAFPDQPAHAWRLFATGSGSGPLCPPTGAKFVQEVNAVTLAVEHKHPDVLSVIELGGQDAKIIMFKEDTSTGQKTAGTSMNDKCASGTGATIDKCMIKVGAEPGYANSLHFNADKLHHVAAKCGVFAETDIVNLVKSGIPKDEVLNSLADAIVLQHPQTQGVVARRPQHLSAVLAGVLAKADPGDLARPRLRLPRRRADRRADLRAAKLRSVRGVRGGHVRHRRRDRRRCTSRAGRWGWPGRSSRSPPCGSSRSCRPSRRG